ncbi:MAG: hypothetical protein JRJ12_17765 [Deltaproteobacteria bacterium]|nr:hypothetical protein [Deltaproteobacteria bacterium]MBW2073098.1 hypothetical protein [Deltaproteobacteria bacterium]
MIDIQKIPAKLQPPAMLVSLRSWINAKITMIKGILVAVCGVLLIVAVRVLCSFFRHAEAPEIDLDEVEG